MKNKGYLFFLLLMASVSLSANQKMFINQVSPPDSVRFAKIISAFQNCDIVSALNELKIIANTRNPEDEAYFNFFKANITFYSWKQIDSTNENTSLVVIDSAVKYYEQALSLNSTINFKRLYINSPKSGLDSCATVLARYAKMYFMNEEYLTAMKYYEKILDFKTDPVYYTSAGLTAYKLTSYPKAQIYLNRALDLNPINEKAWIVLTEAYKSTNDTSNAILSASKALLSDSLNQNLLLNYYNIVSHYNRESEIAGAIKRLEKIRPQNDKLYSILGTHYLTKKEFVSAERNFIALAQKTGNSDQMLKLYFNWYLYLIETNVLRHQSGNSTDYIIARNEAVLLIKAKIKPYKLQKSEDRQVQTILQYFAQEFDD